MSGPLAGGLPTPPWQLQRQMLQSYAMMQQQALLNQQQGASNGLGQNNSQVYGYSNLGTYTANSGADYDAAMARWRAERAAAYRNTPSEGIRAGEVIGYRAWLYTSSTHPFLSSITSSTIWKPGEIVEGDIREHGVYAFKTMEQVQAEFHGVGTYYPMPRPYVFGTIKMWGEIIEHEKGYRAQFAKIHTLEHAPDWLNRYQLYGTIVDDRPKRRRSFLEWFLAIPEEPPPPEPPKPKTELEKLREFYGVTDAPPQTP